ncbi:tetratricopeptide repeat protein [Geitlerinema sp. P-1104]|uniref:tetratricopeptide repeat protein n=1 Tax=Geitlerinema sp. P-1104 TaxID=2546230 RepID=UPI001476D9CF|nr:tetratricopeptide repeat protein [Geitlerinema sp. P-1104]NMG58360.1 tetratricopeptide repeat protein [Geitlerinema sp. P-1104]
MRNQPWLRRLRSLPLLTIAWLGLVGPAQAEQRLAHGEDDGMEATYQDYVTRCQKGGDRQAVVACEKALRLRPDDFMTWTNLGVRLGNLGDYEAALEAHNRALRLRPNYSLALANRCADQVALSRFVEAIASCERALQGDGRWGELSPAIAWYNLALAQQGLNGYDRSRASLNRALELDPSLAAAWNRLGYAWERLGDYEEAVNAYRQAVELAPNVSDYRENLNLVQRRLRF